MITDDPDTRTLRVHFLAYNSTPQTTPGKNRPHILPGLIEDEPVFRASIQTPRTLRDARAFSDTTELERHGNRVDVTINDIHEVVMLIYGDD